MTPWSKIASQIETIIPSAFAGALAVAFAAYYEAEVIGQWVDALGRFLVVAVVFFIGLLIYHVYRIILGEWVLYPLRHLIHAGIDWTWRCARRRPRDFLSFTRLLAYHNVPLFFRRQAYSAIRDLPGVLEQGERDRLDVLHATYHLLYLTALEFFFMAAYVGWHQRSGAWRVLVIVGGIFLAMAFGADLRQDTWECFLLRRREERLPDFLRTLGFGERILPSTMHGWSTSIGVRSSTWSGKS